MRLQRGLVAEDGQQAPCNGKPYEYGEQQAAHQAQDEACDQRPVGAIA